MFDTPDVMLCSRYLGIQMLENVQEKARENKICFDS